MSWLPQLSERRQRQVLGVLLVALTGLVAASLSSYRPPVLGARPWAETNASGPVGAWLAHLLVGWLGRIAAWGVPILLVAAGWNRLKNSPPKPIVVRSVAIGLLVLECLALIGLAGSRAVLWSGSVGVGLASAIQGALGATGGAIALVALFVVTLLVTSELGFSALSVLWSWFVKEPSQTLWDRWRGKADVQEVEAVAAAPVAARAATRPRTQPAGAVPPSRALVATSPRIVTPQALETLPEPARDKKEKGEKDDQRVSVKPAKAAKESAARAAAESAEPLAGEVEALARNDVAAKPEPAPRPPAKADPKADAAPAMVGVPYTGGLPPIDLLEPIRDPAVRILESELKAEAQLLGQKLSDFGIRGAVTEVHPGPVVTTFEFEPAPGIKVNQITSREDDLALAMKASRIRIMAPIPGKGTVGVEIPNRSPRKVYLREVLTSEGYRRPQAHLKFALGVDVNGNPVGADLTRMPHLLVAGATGSGKSVYLNVLVTSLLFGKGPDELRFLMIDPKMIELTSYNGIPHLLMPVVTEAKRAAKSLRWAVGEMERRYRMLATCGARNIEGFNDKVTGSRPPTGQDGEPLTKLPYIVILVDELADLMLTMPVEMEEPIGRLAQMARAVGIHLVLATQRPSVDVLTGVIKANFPSRIAFQVSSKTDSRTILDMNGAENLLGMGDMLYLPAGKAEPLRVHAPFVAEGEVGHVADFWRDRAPVEAQATGSLEEALERVAESGDDEDDDELVPEAV
ncbi:MAG TPA: DNA translocase FtsK 4TM domain-containing protein, partial [Candidatus Eisenbacteria bacterium]|nr:DNA translocase FtsK 4TM domain-containing protein [Candidatus Eisenbacteria bacterium]